MRMDTFVALLIVAGISGWGLYAWQSNMLKDERRAHKESVEDAAEEAQLQDVEIAELREAVDAMEKTVRETVEMKDALLRRQGEELDSTRKALAQGERFASLLEGSVFRWQKKYNALRARKRAAR